MANLTPEACRAARALLGWGVRRLATEAEMGADSISAFENGRPMRDNNRERIAAIFDAAGVEILNGNAPGARFKPQRSLDSDS